MSNHVSVAPSIEESIKAEGIRLGFSLVGITPPKSPTSLPTYLDWLAKGHFGDMAWMATDRARHYRQNPIDILPNCKSILVLAARYPLSWSPQPAQTGRIAGYARHTDYHNIFISALLQLSEFIQSLCGHSVSSKAYTDTGPILEREFAQRAGLGWIGKNSCLISPTHGSNLLLAELFLSVPLQPDKPFEYDRCGGCQRCIQACPTGCILPNRTIDAQRCLSYLTIENKAAIPENMTVMQSGWAFGCDICQQVCPWNKQTMDLPPSPFFVNPNPEFIALEAGIAMTDDEFAITYAHTPVNRTRINGFRRNLVALAASAIPDDLTTSLLLETLMNDPHPVVRQQTAISLVKRLGPACLAYLQFAQEHEKDLTNRAELERLIQLISGQPLG